MLSRVLTVYFLTQYILLYVLHTYIIHTYNKTVQEFSVDIRVFEHPDLINDVVRSKIDTGSPETKIM